MRRPTRRLLFRVAIHACHVPHPDFIGKPLPYVLTRRQLVECQAYYQLEPWGPERDSWHAAQITTAIMQPWTKRRLRVEDFLLKFGPTAKTKPKSLSEKLKLVAIGLKAQIVKRGERNG